MGSDHPLAGMGEGVGSDQWGRISGVGCDWMGVDPIRSNGGRDPISPEST